MPSRNTTFAQLFTAGPGEKNHLMVYAWHGETALGAIVQTKSINRFAERWLGHPQRRRAVQGSREGEAMGQQEDT